MHKLKNKPIQIGPYSNIALMSFKLCCCYVAIFDTIEEFVDTLGSFCSCGDPKNLDIIVVIAVDHNFFLGSL